MKDPSLILTLLSEHVLKVDERVLEKQERSIGKKIIEKYGREIRANMSIAEVFALNERIEPGLLGKSSMVHEITQLRGECLVRLFNYRCPLHRAAESNPDVCKIVTAYFKALAKTCGWEIRKIRGDRDPDCCDYTMRVGKP